MAIKPTTFPFPVLVCGICQSCEVDGEEVICWYRSGWLVERGARSSTRRSRVQELCRGSSLLGYGNIGRTLLDADGEVLTEDLGVYVYSKWGIRCRR